MLGELLPAVAAGIWYGYIMNKAKSNKKKVEYPTEK